MQALLNIFKKIFIVEYYRKNLGFFLFLLYVLFGMEQKPILFHKELITSIVSNKTELFVTLIIFLFYHFKCLFFITRRIKNKEYGFLSEMQSYSMFQQITAICFSYIIVAFPVTLYAFFIISIGIQLQYISSVVILLLFLIFIHALGIFICYAAIQNSFSRKKIFSLSDKLLRIKKHIIFLPIWYSLNKGQLHLIGVKFFSLLMLSVMCVWNRNDYTFSDFLFFFQCSIAAHALLVLNYVEFYEQQFFIRRNLPLPVWKIFLSYLLCYFILALPEIFSMIYFGIGTQAPTNVFIMTIIYLGELLLFTAVLYEKGMSKERYFIYVALLFIVILFLFSFKIFWLMAFGFIAVSFLLFQSLFYAYEPNAEEKKRTA